MASLETTRGRQVPAWQQANRYYQQPVDYVNVRQPESTNVSTAPATRRRRTSNGSYTIQKGDTLSAIAQRYGTTVQAIAEANGITDVNKIYVGDSLNIPGNTTARTTNTPTKRTNPTSTSTKTRTNTITSKNSSKNVTQQTQQPVYSPVTETGFTEQQMADINRYVSSLKPTTKTTANKDVRQQTTKGTRSNVTLADVRKNSLKYKVGKNAKRNIFSNQNNRILNKIAASNTQTSKRDIVRDAIFNK